LIEKRKFKEASQLLESIGMVREAISILETSGFVDDACNILLRMQLPERAARVYAKHGRWQQAAHCFKMADMPMEVAKCAREAGNFELAAEYFLKQQRFIDAAECFEECDRLRDAARLFARGGDRDKAMNLYQVLSEMGDEKLFEDIEDCEVQIIYDHVLYEKNPSSELVDLLVKANKLVDMVVELCRDDIEDRAYEIYVRTTKDIGADLMAKISYTDDSAKNLVEVFDRASNFLHAGMICEQMGDFDRAAVLFGKAGDNQRAAYCEDRNSRKLEATVVAKPAMFSLANKDTGEGGKAESFAESEEDDATVIVDKKAAS
jgi:tetratricopeptide (TPR) repeat protein